MGKITRGRLCKYPEEMNIGDYISCGYRPIDSMFGVFFNLGNAEDLPYLDPAKANENNRDIGRFDFIKVDENVFIADRVLKANIDPLYFKTTPVSYNQYNRYIGFREIENRTILPIHYKNDSQDFIISNFNKDNNNAVIPFGKNLRFYPIYEGIYTEQRPSNIDDNDFLSVKCKKEQTLKCIRIRKIVNKSYLDRYIRKFNIYIKQNNVKTLIYTGNNDSNKDIFIKFDKFYKFNEIIFEIVRGDHSPIIIECIDIYDRDVNIIYANFDNILGGFKYGDLEDENRAISAPNSIAYPNNNEYDKYIVGNEDLFNTQYFYTLLKETNPTHFVADNIGTLINSYLEPGYYYLGRGKCNKETRVQRDPDNHCFSQNLKYIGLRPKITLPYYNQYNNII